MKLVLFLFLATFIVEGFGGTIFHDGERDFEIRYKNNIEGNIAAIGNTVQCITSWNSFFAKCTTRREDINNKRITKYLDIDNNSSTFNSTSAILNLPEGSEVIWAGLYWQGLLHECNNSNILPCRYRNSNNIVIKGSDLDLSQNSLDSNKILFKPPNSNSYIEIEAEQLDYRHIDKFVNYSAFSEVTDLIDATNPNGEYFAANIQSMEGKDRGGNYGAWSLVVVYKNKNETFKNIAIFDGLKAIYRTDIYGRVEINVRGFLTPEYGDIESKLIIFTSEGEYKLGPDYVKVDGSYVSNSDSAYNDIFNSSISGFDRNPKLVNNNGIDIDIFDVSNFLKHNQTETTIEIIARRDGFHPSMIAFATQIYQPKICYEEKLYDLDGNEIGSNSIIKVGDTITSKITIKNDENKDAQDINIIKVFDENITKYKENSTYVKDVDWQNRAHIDDNSSLNGVNVTYDNNVLTIGPLGEGTTSTIFKPYSIYPDHIAFIDFNFTVESNTSFALNYKTTYTYSFGNQEFEYNDILPKCSEFNNTISAHMPDLGSFNVVNENYSGQNVPTNLNGNINSLFTQIVGKSFKVKIVKLENDLVTPEEYDGTVTLSLIETPNFSSATTEEEKKLLCKAATPLYQQNITFNNQKFVEANIIYNKAHKNLTFRIEFQKNGATEAVCARDNFSIRPDSYSIGILSPSPYIGGKNYPMEINATLYNSNINSNGYNQTIDNSVDKNITFSLVLPQSCTSLSSNPTLYSNSIAFYNGLASNVHFKYDNVGEINLTFVDSEWTSVDQILKSDGSIDCIPNSDTNTPINGKIGCLIKGSKLFTFNPKTFKNDFSIQNHNTVSNFTYISNDANMSAKIGLITKAILDNNATATNYTKGCFAKDINYTISLINNKTLSWSDTVNRIKFFESSTSDKLSLKTFKSTEGNFTSGIANLSFGFNFDRKTSIADEPFIISKNDFNITVQEISSSITGADFNRSNDQNVTFYYGRVHAPDYIDEDRNRIINALIYYEVYMKNGTDFANLKGNESVNDVYWYINTKHKLSDGNISSLTPKNGAIISISPAHSTTINSGVEQYTLVYNGSKFPYKDKININSSSWLIFNIANPSATSNSFSATFPSPSSEWSGVGKTGKTVDLNISTSTQRRIEW